MSKPKVIVFDSPDPKSAYRAALTASQFAAEAGYRCQFATFTEVVNENVTRFFALPLSRDAYAGDEPISEFFDNSPNAIYEMFHDLMVSKFGKAYYGRIMARRLHRDNISGVYLIHESTYPAGLLAIANEIDVANMLIVTLAHPTMVFDEQEPTRDMRGYETNTILNSIRKVSLPVVPTPELTQLVIRGSIKDFLGIKETA